MNSARLVFITLMVGALMSNPNAFGKGIMAESFIKKAGIANMFEIESSRLVESHGKNQELKSFAERMIRDHSEVGDGLKDAVDKADLDPSLIPTALDEEHQKKLDKLAKQNGKDFDEDYLKMQKNAHKDAVDLFEDYANRGDNVELQAFAMKTLPTLREHLRHVNNITQ